MSEGGSVCITLVQRTEILFNVFPLIREISRAAGKTVSGIIDEDNSGNDSQ